MVSDMWDIESFNNSSFEDEEDEIMLDEKVPFEESTR